MEKVEVASLGKGWSGGAETVAEEKGQAGENALDWREKKGSAGLVGVGTEPDSGAYAVGGSWGWAEQGTPSVAEGVAADRPADWLLPPVPEPGGAGPSVPCSLAASAAYDAASTAAATAAAVEGSQLLGAAETGYGWPSPGQGLALRPAAAASSAVASRCLGTVKAWRCDSCSPVLICFDNEAFCRDWARKSFLISSRTPGHYRILICGKTPHLSEKEMRGPCYFCAFSGLTCFSVNICFILVALLLWRRIGL